MRLTSKDFNYTAPALKKLCKLENLMDKYGFKTVEEVDNFIKKHICEDSVMGDYKLV